MKVFKASRQSQRRKPIEFGVGGEVFSVPLPLPGYAMLDLASIQDDGEQQRALAALSDFLREVIPEDDFARFRKAVTKERLPLDADDENAPSILGIVQYILGEASGAPLDKPSPSARPRAKSGKL